MASLKIFLLIFLLCSLFGNRLVVSVFSPKDKIFISCGENKAIELEDGRLFEPDLGNSNVDLSANSDSVVSNTGLSMPIIYTSARVFTGTAKYTFSIKQVGQHWLRLYLYPVQNSNYDLKTAVFSVVANGITLLHGFSFSKLRNSSPLLKEYVVEVAGSSSGYLALTLSPWNSSMAFINGIEVMSVPDGQFNFSVVPIPLGSQFVVPMHVALETVHRINVGGSLLTPKNDTLWRTWKPDTPFLLNAASACNVSKNPRSIEYPVGTSVEIAPNWVYATAQEMADVNVTEQKFNKTWAFGVEQGYNYFVRMHFCDIVSNALETLIFNVYINNQSATNSFDISSKIRAAAYFTDFALNVSKGTDQITVQVGPSISSKFPCQCNSSTDSLDGNFTGIPADSKVPKTKRHVMLVFFVSVGS